MARRRRGGSAEASSERWLVTYADLITLLLVFFVVMYSISKADSAKFQRFSTSVQQAFRVDVMEPGQPLGPSLAEQDFRFMSYLSIRGQIAALVQRYDLGMDAADVELTSEGIVIHLSDAVLFPPGEAQLRPEAHRVLAGIAAIVGPMPFPVRVEGHTDNVPPASPNYPDNWALSTMRAVSTVRYLSDIQGVPAERLVAVGYAEHRPRADNSTLEGRRKNRRVDLVVVHPAADRESRD